MSYLDLATPPRPPTTAPHLSMLTLLRCSSARLFPSAAWFPGRMGPKGTSLRWSRIMNAPGPMSPTLFRLVVFPHRPFFRVFSGVKNTFSICAMFSISIHSWRARRAAGTKLVMGGTGGMGMGKDVIRSAVCTAARNKRERERVKAYRGCAPGEKRQVRYETAAKVMHSLKLVGRKPSVFEVLYTKSFATGVWVIGRQAAPLCSAQSKKRQRLILVLHSTSDIESQRLPLLQTRCLLLTAMWH